MNLRTASAFAALTATLLVAGCGSDSDSGKPAAAGKPAESAYEYGAPADAKPTTAAATVKAAASDLGTILTDAEGRTLYLWEADAKDKSACDGPCAAAWPPLTTTDKPAAIAGAKADLLGTAKRAD